MGYVQPKSLMSKFTDPNISEEERRLVAIEMLAGYNTYAKAMRSGFFGGLFAGIVPTVEEIKAKRLQQPKAEND